MKTIGKDISIHGHPIGESGRGLLSRVFERQVKACFGDGAPLYGDSERGSWRGGLLYWAF
jgi:hypothetical protein